MCHGIDVGEGERGSKSSSCERGGGCVVVMIMEEWDGVEQKV